MALINFAGAVGIMEDVVDIDKSKRSRMCNVFDCNYLSSRCCVDMAFLIKNISYSRDCNIFRNIPYVPNACRFLDVPFYDDAMFSLDLPVSLNFVSSMQTFMCNF